MVYLSELPTIEYKSNSFSLNIKLSQSDLRIVMLLYSLPLSTKNLTRTNHILKSELPTIYSNRCYNQDNLSFFEEVKNTEIAHLFEHILMEKIFQSLNPSSSSDDSIAGKTSWNWEKEPIGKFHIQLQPINLARKDLFDCLSQSIQLTDKILSSQKTTRYN